MDQHSSGEVVGAVKFLLAGVDYGQLDLEDWIVQKLPEVILDCSGKPTEEFTGDIEALIEYLKGRVKENEESPSPVPLYSEGLLGEAEKLQKCLKIFKQAIQKAPEVK